MWSQQSIICDLKNNELQKRFNGGPPQGTWIWIQSGSPGSASVNFRVVYMNPRQTWARLFSTVDLDQNQICMPCGAPQGVDFEIGRRASEILQKSRGLIYLKVIKKIKKLYELRLWDTVLKYSLGLSFLEVSPWYMICTPSYWWFSRVYSPCYNNNNTAIHKVPFPKLTKCNYIATALKDRHAFTHITLACVFVKWT